MKKIIASVLAIALFLSLAGCGASSKPEDVVSTYCNAMKNFDTETASQCMVSGDSDFDDALTSDEEGDGANLGDERLIEYLKTNAAKMTFKVGTATVEGDTATVPVSFTYVDASAVISAALGEYITQALGLALSGADEATMEELFTTIFLEKAEATELGEVTSDITFRCEKVDDTWKITTPSDEDVAAISAVISGNITSVLESMSESFEGEDDIPEESIWHDVPLGEEVQLATLKICVTNCEELTELTAEYWEPDIAQEGTKFVVFHVDVENTTKETINFDGDIDLTDSQGRTYETYSDALWYYDDTFSYTDLAPNIKQSGTLIYNVPTDSVDYYLTVAKAGTNDAYRLLGK